MPLLGRNKSLPGGNQAAAIQKQQQAAPALVCESPLFGTRRQLPSSTASRQQSSTGGGKQSLSKHQSWSTGAKGSRPSSPQAPDAASAAETLGSIPKQITRQQIRYAFNIMDTNADGLIDLRDLSQMLANLGVPIDEAILSHVMSSVSKRGDHRISEAEFLDWIGNFIQVSDLDANLLASSQSGSLHERNQRRGAASRSSSSPMSANSSTRFSSPALVAQSEEAQQLIQQQMRQRRGSGSGLALMRSLSSSAGGATSSSRDSDDRKQAELDGKAEAADKRSSLAAEQQKEACDDLKAAFCVFDLDGDGFITIDEVQQGLKLLGESWSLAELNHLLFSKCEPASQTGGQKAAKASAGGAQKQRISIDDFVKLLL